MWLQYASAKKKAGAKKWIVLAKRDMIPKKRKSTKMGYLE